MPSQPQLKLMTELLKIEGVKVFGRTINCYTFNSQKNRDARPNISKTNLESNFKNLIDYRQAKNLQSRG
jgi:hypothetical protein